MSCFYKTWGGMRTLVVLYVFYELFVSNKFEVAVRIIGIQSIMNVNVCLQYELIL